jgi:hypothetical protein
MVRMEPRNVSSPVVRWAKWSSVTSLRAVSCWPPVATSHPTLTLMTMAPFPYKPRALALPRGNTVTTDRSTMFTDHAKNDAAGGTRNRCSMALVIIGRLTIAILRRVRALEVDKSREAIAVLERDVGSLDSRVHDVHPDTLPVGPEEGRRPAVHDRSVELAGRRHDALLRPVGLGVLNARPTSI